MLIIISIGKFLFTNWKAFPKGFSAIIILIILLTNVYTAIKSGDWSGAITEIGQTIFSAEIVMREITQMAISNSPDYTIFQFLKWLNSFFVVYFMIKYAGVVLIKFTGSQAEWMAYILGAGFFAILEVVVIKSVDGKWFSPLWDGMVFSLRNLDSIFGNIYFLPWEWFKNWFFNYDTGSMTNITSNISIDNTENMVNFSNLTK